MVVTNITDVVIHCGYYKCYNYIVVIDRCINNSRQGIRKIYGINGSEKSYVIQKMFIMGTKEAKNESTRANEASMIYDTNKKYIFNFFLKIVSGCVILKTDAWM